MFRAKPRRATSQWLERRRMWRRLWRCWKRSRRSWRASWPRSWTFLVRYRLDCTEATADSSATSRRSAEAFTSNSLRRSLRALRYVEIERAVSFAFWKDILFCMRRRKQYISRLLKYALPVTRPSKIYHIERRDDIMCFFLLKICSIMSIYFWSG